MHESIKIYSIRDYGSNRIDTECFEWSDDVIAAKAERIEFNGRYTPPE